MRFILQRALLSAWVVCLLTGCNSPQTSHPVIETPAQQARTAALGSPGLSVPETILVWDANHKTYRAKPGEESAAFVFNVTNVSPAEVVIESTATSCGCTVADLPADPWRIPPGGHGRLEVTMDLNGQNGTVTKEVTVFTSKGSSLLTVEAVVPER